MIRCARPAPPLLLVGLLLLAACSEQNASGKPTPQPAGMPVTAATVEQRAVPVEVRAIGNVQAIASVTMMSQVDGQVDRVHFAEGQDVKKGEPLFTLDQRPFRATLQQAEATLARDEAQLRQAEANVAKDQAQLNTARVQMRRYKELLDDGAISYEQWDQVRTTAETLDAAVQADRAAVENARAVIKADQAMVENARIQFGYTVIRAPMDGRTGNLMVHEGNAVKARDQAGAMVVINQIHPIYITFSVPEQNLPDIKKYRAAGTLRVEAYPADQAGGPARGEVTFINNTVDQATGTIQLKATFPNGDNRLWPGQFVNVVLTLTTEPHAIVVPTQAVQSGQRGTYVFVIKPDMTVESRPVVLGVPAGNDTVVQKGLNPGERVVTEGQMRLVPGVRVDVKPPAQPPASPGRAG